MGLTAGGPLKEGSKQDITAYWTARGMPFTVRELGKLHLMALWRFCCWVFLCPQITHSHGVPQPSWVLQTPTVC